MLDLLTLFFFAFFAAIGVFIITFLKSKSMPKVPRMFKLFGRGLTTCSIIVIFASLIYNSIYLLFFVYLPLMLIGAVFMQLGEKRIEQFSTTIFLKELKDISVKMVMLTPMALAIPIFILYFSLLKLLPIIEMFIGASFSIILFLAYRRKYRATAYFSLFSGITMILLSVFLPTVSLNPAFKFPRFIDIGGIVLGVIFLIVSLKSYRKFTAKTQSPDKN